MSQNLLSISSFHFRIISEQVIQEKSWRWRRMRGIPVIKFSYVLIKDILETDKAFVGALHKVTEAKNPLEDK